MSDKEDISSDADLVNFRDSVDRFVEAPGEYNAFQAYATSILAHHFLKDQAMDRVDIKKEYFLRFLTDAHRFFHALYELDFGEDYVPGRLEQIARKINDATKMFLHLDPRFVG